MGYDPVRESRSSEGSVVPAPKNGQVRNTVFKEKGKNYCLIEWQDNGYDSWILAANDDSFVNLDNNL